VIAREGLIKAERYRQIPMGGSNFEKKRFHKKAKGVYLKRRYPCGKGKTSMGKHEQKIEPWWGGIVPKCPESDSGATTNGARFCAENFTLKAKQSPTQRSCRSKNYGGWGVNATALTTI